MSPEALRALLSEAHTIAVVGLSPNARRPSHVVARYLRDAGYRIVPVNPGHATLLGERCYPTLTAAARECAIDVVDVFRRSEFAGAVVDEAIPLRPRLIWLQVGVVDETACDRAAAADIPLEVLHRVAAMAAGGMDTLPHNGAIITLLAITGLTHRQSYRDIFAITCIKTGAVFVVIAVYYLTGIV